MKDHEWQKLRDEGKIVSHLVFVPGETIEVRDVPYCHGVDEEEAWVLAQVVTVTKRARGKPCERLVYWVTILSAVFPDELQSFEEMKCRKVAT